MEKGFDRGKYNLTIFCRISRFSFTRVGGSGKVRRSVVDNVLCSWAITVPLSTQVYKLAHRQQCKITEHCDMDWLLIKEARGGIRNWGKLIRYKTLSPHRTLTATVIFMDTNTWFRSHFEHQFVTVREGAGWRTCDGRGASGPSSATDRLH